MQELLEMQIIPGMEILPWELIDILLAEHFAQMDLLNQELQIFLSIII